MTDREHGCYLMGLGTGMLFCGAWVADLGQPGRGAAIALCAVVVMALPLVRQFVVGR